ncbi:MAG TPA: TlpA disulfide reductase family protein [Thermoanaerobaculia bacterium]|nr:TlpA disulfide reductase family protein [Thermoanaerobaculia bacterium]
MKRTFLLLLVLVVLASACKRREQASQTRGGQPAQSQQTTTGSDLGSTMPEYSATTLDGAKFDLAARRDKVVLLNLWATWCGPCRFEIPELQKMHTEYGPKGFEVIGVSVDEGGPDPVKQFVKEHEMTYPVVLDPEGKLANLFQTSVLPTTALIDRKGRIVWKHYGLIEANDATLKQAIEKAL